MVPSTPSDPIMRRPKPTSERSKSSAGPFTPATRMPREGGLIYEPRIEKPIQVRRSALRAHAAALPIRRDSPDRARLEMRRRYDASRPLRGRACAADWPARPLEYTQGLGYEHSEAPEHAEGGRGGRAQARDRTSSDVARRDRLPVVGGPGSLSSQPASNTELLQRGGGPCGDDGSGRDRGNSSDGASRSRGLDGSVHSL